MLARWMCLLWVIAFAGCASFADRIPPRDETVTSMELTAIRIGMYMRQNASLPKSLAVIPEREGYYNRTTDGWSRPLIYRHDDDGFSLTSLGRDGVPGGNGEDADVVRKFHLVNG